MRCEDCLDDLPSTHFVVLDPPEDDPDDIDEKHVCAQCVGWYRDVIEVSE